MACQDFFNRSEAWREEIPFSLPAGERSAEIMPFAGRIERLLYVKGSDGRPINGALMPDVYNGLVTMPHAPNQNEKYVAVVVVTVSDPVSRDAYPIVPFEIANRYTTELMHGVLYRMMSQQSKPYTNLSLAQFYLAKFIGGASRARNAINTQNTNGAQAWMFPQTFNRR